MVQLEPDRDALDEKMKNVERSCLLPTDLLEVCANTGLLLARQLLFDSWQLVCLAVPPSLQIAA